MDTLFLFPFYIFLLMLPILGVIMYFVMVRKNAFEERLALYRPQHQLSQKREDYLKGVHKLHFRYFQAFSRALQRYVKQKVLPTPQEALKRLYGGILAMIIHSRIS